MVRLAIVVPVYGQAELLSETVVSLLSQEGGDESAIVLVDDTCPDPRTPLKSLAFSAAYPDRVLYWRSPVNRGLSAMRNEGVRRALETWPDLKAVAFVDGDDKTFDHYVARGLALIDRYGGQPTEDGGRVGWIYEDWNQFGTPENLHAPAPFHPLFALAACQHTPGCVCLADMFREGLWFDEKRRGGDAEDWQFWVNCYAHGWRGKHADAVGFRYRRRVGGLAFEGRQAAERNKVLVQQEFAQLYHPDAYTAYETGEMARYLEFDERGATIDGASLDDDALAQLLVRVAQLPTTTAPAHALFFVGPAREILARSRMLEWARWITEARAADGVVTLSLRASDGGFGSLSPATADVAYGADAAVISMPLLKLASAVVDGGELGELIAGDDARHMRLDMIAPALEASSDGRAIHEHANYLFDVLEPFDQPGHRWSREGVWRPHGANRSQLDEVYLTYKAPLKDPLARSSSILVINEDDLAWRTDDLDLGAVSRFFWERDGVAPSLCILGTAIPVDVSALGTFRTVHLVPGLEEGLEWAKPFNPTGILAAFGTVVSLDCERIVPDANGVRRFGCLAAAVLPRTQIAPTNLAGVMLNSFKSFRTVLVRNEMQCAHLMALGVSREVLNRDLMDAERKWSLSREYL